MLVVTEVLVVVAKVKDSNTIKKMPRHIEFLLVVVVVVVVA